MENEKIYVVVPVYKVEAYLERCVESILNQTYDNYELILVDDGSPDNCPAICDRYAVEHDNITVIHQENGGLSVARNTGVAYAREHGDDNRDWITFIDSDDFVHPKYLEYLHRAAKEAGVEISSCGFIVSDASEIDAALIEPLKYECLTPEEYWCRNFTNATVAWGKLYRVNLFENILYPKGKIYEDNFTTYKLLFQHDRLASIEALLYCWYTNSRSITRSAWTPKQLDVMEALESQLAFFEEKGYPAAYKASAKEIFRHSVKQTIAIRLMSPKYDHMISQMLDRRKKAFKLIVKELGFIHAVMYWFEIRIIKSIKRVLRNESVFSFVKRKLIKHFRH